MIFLFQNLGFFFDLKSAYLPKTDETIEQSKEQTDFEDAYYKNGVMDYLEYKLREDKIELSEIKMIYQLSEKSKFIEQLKKSSIAVKNKIDLDLINDMVKEIKEKIAAIKPKTKVKKKKTWANLVADLASDQLAERIVRACSKTLEERRSRSLKRFFSKYGAEYAKKVYIFVMKNSKIHICYFGSLTEVKMEDFLSKDEFLDVNKHIDLVLDKKGKIVLSHNMVYWLLCMYLIYLLYNGNLIGFSQ